MPCGAGMVAPLKVKEYVFYYNYVTRFLALFHVFIAVLSQEETIGPSTRCEGHKQGWVGEGAWERIEDRIRQSLGFVREVCHPGKG